MRDGSMLGILCFAAFHALTDTSSLTCPDAKGEIETCAKRQCCKGVNVGGSFAEAAAADMTLQGCAECREGSVLGEDRGVVRITTLCDSPEDYHLGNCPGNKTVDQFLFSLVPSFEPGGDGPACAYRSVSKLELSSAPPNASFSKQGKYRVVVESLERCNSACFLLLVGQKEGSGVWTEAGCLNAAWTGEWERVAGTYTSERLGALECLKGDQDGGVRQIRESVWLCRCQGPRCNDLEANHELLHQFGVANEISEEAYGYPYAPAKTTTTTTKSPNAAELTLPALWYLTEALLILFLVV